MEGEQQGYNGQGTLMINSRCRVAFKVSVKGIVTPEVTLEEYNTEATDTLKKATSLLDEAIAEAKKRSTE